MTDVAASVRWYQEHFTCRVSYQDATWAMLDFENIQLALVVPGEHPPHVSITRPADQIEGPLETHRDGTRSRYVRDPAGNAVERLADEPAARR